MNIFGIGNPLIDILIQVEENDIVDLGLSKGTMHLIDLDERSHILNTLQSRPIEYRCGGSCPNTIITLASLGIEAAVGGKVGKDKEGDEYIRMLKEISPKSTLKQGDEATGSSIILITPDTERTMNTYLGANREFSLVDLDVDMVYNADYFYFTGYMWDTEEQKAAILKAIEVCREGNTKVVFDVADPFAVTRNHDDFINLLNNHVDILFANCEEAKILYGCNTLEGCVDRLGRVCDIAVVKDGSRGSIVHTRTEDFQIPVFKVDAIDSTGAGDTYAAGFLYGLSQGLSAEESGYCASWLASKIVTVKGAQFNSDQFLVVKAGLDAGEWKK